MNYAADRLGSVSDRHTSHRTGDPSGVTLLIRWPTLARRVSRLPATGAVWCRGDQRRAVSSHLQFCWTARARCGFS
jgi:hypothetical protein